MILSFDEVPRRSKRQFFYQHGLNTYVTKITSDTIEDDIVQNSSKQFLIVGSLTIFLPKVFSFKSC